MYAVYTSIAAMSRLPRKPKPKDEADYHHGDLRKALIAAALRAIERDGVGALSLRALARSLGVSPRAPYRHFTTKEQLLAAVAVEGYRMSASFMESRLAAATDPMGRLRTTVEAYVLFAAEHPAAFRVMYAPYATVEEDAPDLRHARAEGHGEMMRLIVGVQQSGAIRAGDPMLLALTLWSTMHGLAVLLVEGQLGRFDRPIEGAKLARVVAAMVFEGLLARAK
ncbi:MAG TPA: TetR/AcrR family transcriptional regulator [Polyangiaceae bacterium]|jgi:AcrR family transcriptional regulator|nr:TetR/AcrR family transcriptional regulator [Polyangiaceae bacterium]